MLIKVVSSAMRGAQERNNQSPIVDAATKTMSTTATIETTVSLVVQVALNE